MKIWEAIITEAWQFILPFRLGRIYIYTPISHTNKYIDWKSSKLLGKKVSRLNLHTGGKTFKVRWNKQLTTIKHLTVYNFKPARGEYGDKYVGTRGIARYIIETSNDPLKKNFRAHLI